MLIVVNLHVHSSSPEITCVVHVLEALHALGKRGKIVIVEDSITINSHPNLLTLWSLPLLKYQLYLCIT